MATRKMKRFLGPWILVIACGPPAAENGSQMEDLSTEEVAPPVDVGLSTEEDVKGELVVEGVAGVLPETYPRDLPIYQPSSLVDFGERPGGSFVEFYSPSRLGDVEQTLGGRLEEAGWEFSGRADGDWTVWRDGRTVRIGFTDSRPGTTIRVEYP